MKREFVVDQRRVNAFYRTSLLVSVIVELLRCKQVRNEPAFSKIQPDGTRKEIRGVRASCVYFAMECLGVSQEKTKEILDAMVMKSQFLVRELAVRVDTKRDGTLSNRTNQEYVYELRDRDEIDEAVINAMALMPEVPFRVKQEEEIV